MSLVLLRETVLFLHDEALREHGGLPGIRDDGLLISALQRPDDKAYYEPDANLFDLAASLAFGLAKNHPFHDANKRTALAATDTFLILNGFSIEASAQEKFQTFVALASDLMSEPDLARWLERQSLPFHLDASEADHV